MDAVNKKFICKPRLKWKCPPKIALSHNWHVAAGEESEEAKTQKLREKKIPEAVYRRLSHIPSSPSSPWNAQEDHLDESQIPLIPMTPIEEDEQPEEIDSSFSGTKVLLPSSSAASQRDVHSQIKPFIISELEVEAGSSTQADVALAAATAVTALLKSKESGSFIDTDLLVKIFSDPKTVKKLMSEVASSSSKTKPVSETTLLKASMHLASSKPVFVEKVDAEHGSLKNSVETSSPNPITALKKNTDDNRAAIDKGNISFSNSGQVKCELTPFDKGVAPFTRPNSLPAQFTFLSQPDLMVHKSTSLPIMPIGQPLPSLPSSKSDLDEFKWTDNGYGVPIKTNIEPITRRNLFSPEVTLPPPNEGLLQPTMMNIYPLPKETRTDFKLKAILSDAVRPTDSLLMSASSGASRVNPYLFSNQAQPVSQMKAPLLHQGKPSLQTPAPFPNLERSSLEMNRPFPNPLQPGVQMMGAAVNARPSPFLPNVAPQLHDKNYLKALVQQHGEIQQDRDNSIRFHQQTPKPVPYYDPNVLAMKIQRPCFFFNSPEGCKHGYSCPYVHGQPQNIQLGTVMGTHSSKRMRLDGETLGVHR